MDLSKKKCVYALHNKKATAKADGRKKRKMKQETKALMLLQAQEELKKQIDGDTILIENNNYHYFKYLIYKYNVIVYVQVNDFLRYDCSTSYNYGLEYQQKSYFETNINDIEDLIDFIKYDLKRKQKPVKEHKDRLSLQLYQIVNGETELQKMKKMFGYREKTIFNNLFYIKIDKYDNKELITFYDHELNYFQYSISKHVITN